MRLRFVTVPVFDSDDAEAELNELLATYRAVTVDRQFVSDGPRRAWVVCVTWAEREGHDAPRAAARAAHDAPRRERIDDRNLLSPDEFAVFAKLRTLRKHFAEADGIPTYAVFTNEQLADMTRRPDRRSGCADQRSPGTRLSSRARRRGIP